MASGLRERQYFLYGRDHDFRRHEDGLHHAEDLLDSGDHFTGCSVDNLNVCDHFLHLPNQFRQDQENGRRD
jgi:hypothetical protein